MSNLLIPYSDWFLTHPKPFLLYFLISGLPVELYGVFYPIYPYQFGELTCKLRAFLIEFTSYASIVTITGFSVERWLAIW